MADKNIILACRNLWKIYGDRPTKYLKKLGAKAADMSYEDFTAAGYVVAVRDVNLDISGGEILVIMGLSGSGKSTLVRCLSRLIEATSGEITIEGADLRVMSDDELLQLRRNKMGMVFQNFALLPHRTVLGNVLFPLEMRGQDKFAARERALEMIKLVGLEGREDYFPRELSGGQQQRVGIARSLAIEPDIWFLDEPFSALDPLIRREMQNEFLRLQELLDKTIVFITHDFDEALRLADRIAIMKDGAVQQIGAPGEIVLNPANEYVAKFTEEVDKRRIVRAGFLARKTPSNKLSGAAVQADDILQDIAKDLIGDKRDIIPVRLNNGSMHGMKREAALKILLGV